MILAAGLGTRMRPLTDSCPKPLLKVAGKPLIQHHIEGLVACGIRRLVINLSWLGEQIEAFVGDGSRWGAEVSYSREATLLETGGGIHQALPLLSARGEPFLVVNGDIWSDFDYSALHLRSGDLACLVMVGNPDHHPGGDFMLSGGRLTGSSAAENAKPLAASAVNPHKSGENLTFSGISVLSPRLFDGLQAGAFPLAPLLRRAIADGRVSGRHHAGRWIDVGTPERLQQLDELLLQAESDDNSTMRI